jgi:hypothetical protein
MIYIPGREFAAKLAKGHRIFNVRFEEGFDLSASEFYPEFKKVLENSKPENPLIYTDSEARYLIAPGIPLAFLQAEGADLTG